MQPVVGYGIDQIEDYWIVRKIVITDGVILTVYLLGPKCLESRNWLIFPSDSTSPDDDEKEMFRVHHHERFSSVVEAAKALYETIVG